MTSHFLTTIAIWKSASIILLLFSVMLPQQLCKTSYFTKIVKYHQPLQLSKSFEGYCHSTGRGKGRGDTMAKKNSNNLATKYISLPLLSGLEQKIAADTVQAAQGAH